MAAEQVQLEFREQIQQLQILSQQAAQNPQAQQQVQQQTLDQAQAQHQAQQQVIDQAAAFEVVEVVFAAMARRDAQNFPVVRQAIGHADALTYCNTTVKIERNH